MEIETIEKIDNGLLINGLPVYVADDDFIDHLAEMGYSETIEEVEMYEEWDIWAKENVEP